MADAWRSNGFFDEVALQVPATSWISKLAAGIVCLTISLMSNTLTIRLPEDLSRWLEEEARATGLPKGKIVKEQLERLRNARTRQPFLDLAGRVDGAPGLSAKKGFSK